MRVINFSYQALSRYRYTYYPAIEQRLLKDIALLRASPAPFGKTRMPYMARDVQLRIVEELALNRGLPHPRLLSCEDFRVRLPGWTVELQGMYKFYFALHRDSQQGGMAIDFMLDRLGIERFDRLAPQEELKMYLQTNGRIYYNRTSKAAKKYAVEALVRAANPGHARLLRIEDFNNIIVPELGIVLSGFLAKYSSIHALLDDLDYPAFDSLSVEEQLKALKLCQKIRWEDVPKTTKLFLIGLLKNKLPNNNGIACPHERVIGSDPYKKIFLEEIETTMAGLIDYYRRQKPAEYQGTVEDYMLDQLGVPKFGDLDFEMQCQCLIYAEKYPWQFVPATTVLLFLNRLKEIVQVPHLRFLRLEDFTNVVIPEIKQSLLGLASWFRVNINDDKNNQLVIDQLLNHYGIDSFEQMPFYMQIEWTHFNKTTRWSKLPDAIIGYYLRQIARKAGLFNRREMRTSHFFLPGVIGEKSASSLLTFFDRQWPREVPGERMLDWALRYYAGCASARKKLKDGMRLSPEEVIALSQFAQMGDRQAMELLLRAYEPFICSQARKAQDKVRGNYLSSSSLMQHGRVAFMRNVSTFSPVLGNFFSYMQQTLGWRIADEIRGEASQFPDWLIDPQESLSVSDVTSERATITSLRQALNEAIHGSGLSKTEILVLKRHQLDGLSLKEIGQQINYSVEGTRKIELAAIRKILDGPYAQILRSFIDSK